MIDPVELDERIRTTNQRLDFLETRVDLLRIAVKKLNDSENKGLITWLRNLFKKCI